MNSLLKPAEIDFILKDAGINTVIVAEPTQALVAGLTVKAINLADLIQFARTGPELPHAVLADDIAVMLYTSGTSGKPKGVPLTHNNLLGNAREYVREGVYELSVWGLFAKPANDEARTEEAV